MKIDKRLNLILSIQTDSASGPLFVHSVPISRAVFENHFLVISKVFSAIYQEGLSLIGGPAVASLMLKQVAKDIGQWDGPEGVQKTLLPEILRLSNAMVPAAGGGYDVMPVEDAYKAGLISEDEFAEIEGQLVFFTFASAMHKRSSLPAVLESLGSLWESQTTSSNVTEY